MLRCAPPPIPQALTATLALIGSILTGCSLGGGDVAGSRASVTEDPVDPIRRRVVPDTETTPRPGLADRLTGSRHEAAVRYSARIKAAPRTTVMRDGRLVRREPTADMDEAQLRAHLRDVDEMAGHARGRGVAESLAAASSSATEPGDRAPTSSQASALSSLEMSSLTDLHIRWDPRRGSPRVISGLLAVDRARTPEEIADRFTTDE